MGELIPPQAHDDSPYQLEELSEALGIPEPLEPLASGTLLETPAGRIRIDAFLDRKGSVNRYQAVFSDDQTIWLYETADAAHAERMRHEFNVLAGLNCPMLPQPYACFDEKGRAYIAKQPTAGLTMADALGDADILPAQLLSALAQVAFAVSQLHAHGWAHLAIRPAAVVLGKPIRLTDFTYSTRLGETPSSAFYFSGYSAPELLTDQPIDARADVYSIGALLFHMVSGTPIPESGASLTGWQPAMPIAGVPQILHKCLGPLETRYATVTDLHRDLLRLLRRCAAPLHYRHASASTIGLEPTRSVNQDAWGVTSMRSEDEDASRAWTVAAVADGMGGMAAGEVASALAVNSILAGAMSALAANPGIGQEAQARLTAELIRKANEAVYSAMEAKGVRGGCTVVCALVIEKRLAIAHVGDCRIYLVRDGTIRPLTRDHSVAMSLVMQGELDISELRTYPERSNVTRSLGERRNLPAHYIDTLAPMTGSDYLELEVGDTLLLCSDGLWEPIEEPTMVEVLADAGTDLDAASRKLLELVLRSGAPDNATVSLLRIDETLQAMPKV